MPVPTGMSGIPSAVGRCIETTGRAVPHTLISGARNSVGIASTNPHRFRIVDPGGGIEGSAEIATPHDEIDGSVELQRTIMTGKSYAGQFPFKGDGENLYESLLMMLGKDVQTQVAGAASTSITPVYKHVFTPNKYFPAFTYEEIFGDANYGRLSAGVVMEGLDLDFNEILQCVERVIAYRQTPNKYGDAQHDFGSGQANKLPTQMGGDGTKCIERTAVPTYVDVAQLNNGNGPFVWGGMTFGAESGHAADFVLVDGAAPTNKPNILPGLRVGLRRAIESFMIGGSGYDRGACVGSQVEATGSMDILFQDNAINLGQLSHSKIAVNAKWEGIYIGSAAVKYGIEVHIPHAKFMRNPLSIPGGAMHVGGDFVCKHDAALGYSIKISLWNSFSNASLAGDAGTTGAQGLGGGFNRS